MLKNYDTMTYFNFMIYTQNVLISKILLKLIFITIFVKSKINFFNVIQ